MNEEIAQQAVQDAPGTMFAQRLQHLELSPYPITLSKYKTIPSELQRRGVNFMIRRETQACHSQFGGLLCDELGLGKTLTVSSTIVERLHADPDEPQKTLVVASSVVLFEWERQLNAHFQPGTLRVKLYYGNTREIPNWNSFDVLLTTYGVVRAEYSRDKILLNEEFVHWARSGADGRRPSVFSKLFHRVVLDEAHAIRNISSAQHEAVCELHAETRWCVTATPVWNALDDLYALFKFLGAAPLCERNTFDGFVNKRMCESPAQVVEHIRQFVLPMELRRTKESLNLPPLTEVTVWVELNENERLFYEALKTFSQDTVQRLFRTESWLRTTGWARAHTTLGQRARQCILSVILRLRQSCVHPQMAIDACKMWNGPAVPAPRLIEAAAARLTALMGARSSDDIEEECIVCFTDPPDNCVIPCGHTFCGRCSATLFALSADAKCPVCRCIIEDYKPICEALALPPDEEEIRIEQEWDPYSSKLRALIDDLKQRRGRDPTTKALVFSQWRTPLDCMAKIFIRENIRFLRVDGTVLAKTRSERQAAFNSDPNIGAMLCSMNCCSEGINLQGANVVYILDLWWTDAKEKQAGNRSHRVGQTRPVEIVHLVATNTIEERVLELQRRKRNIADATNGSSALNRNLWEERILRLLEIR